MGKVLIDAVFSLFLMVGSLYLWFAADALPKLARYKGFDSDFWPKIVLAVIASIAFMLCYQALRTLIQARAESAARTEPSDQEPAEFSHVKLIFTGVLIVLYYFGLQVLGFLLATFIFLTLGIRLIGYGNRFWRSVYPLGFTVLLGFIFAKGLSLPLPTGIGVFETFNRLLF